MGKELAAVAEEFFSHVEGATVEHANGLLKVTATPQQIQDSMQKDKTFAGALWRAMEEVDAMMTPCWECGEHWWEPIPHRRWPRNLRGGRMGLGVANTLHDKNGRCVNCKTVTSVEQVAKLRRREKRAIAAMRKRRTI